MTITVFRDETIEVFYDRSLRLWTAFGERRGEQVAEASHDASRDRAMIYAALELERTRQENRR